MKKSIVLGELPEEQVSLLEKEKRTLHKAKSAGEALNFHIKHHDVDSYIIILAKPNKKEKEEILHLIKSIHYLNSLVQIFIVLTDGKLSDEYKKFPQVNLLDDISRIKDHLKQLTNEQRRTNRLNWPLNIKFWKQGEKANSGRILSISSGGCFIQSADFYKESDEIEMDIFFKDFDFRCTGSIVRLQKEKKETGMGVKFHDVTPQTRACIQMIIDEKILIEIMDILDIEKKE